ncbi:thioredoxin family protein [Pontibacter arcticus]|uniref:Thioredoxin n=1 Tax=Pontibacter arcticus TaxID=2080288 RepID=A0A364RIH8_9BACT|nr:thioredoxin family protein [Pontibacter arcticus]RAU84084.1 thioredoxin [Pontibacter arcticus]
MTIIESNDTELRKLIFEKDKVIVKFTAEDCPVCKEISPVFLALSAEFSPKGITFLRMSAHENPVSRSEVKLTGTPFFATYKNGTILDCGIINSEQGLRKILNRLL